MNNLVSEKNRYKSVRNIRRPKNYVHFDVYAPCYLQNPLKLLVEKQNPLKLLVEKNEAILIYSKEYTLQTSM